MAAVTNYQKFSGLKQHKCILFKICQSEVQNQSHWVEVQVSAVLLLLLLLFLEAPEQIICFLASFLVLEAAAFLGMRILSYIHSSACFRHVTSLTVVFDVTAALLEEPLRLLWAIRSSR